MADFAVVPSRTALINVDMQNCFVHGYSISAPDGLVVLERINRLAAACRSAGVLVIHASIVVRPDGSNLGIMAEFSQPVREGSFYPAGMKPADYLTYYATKFDTVEVDSTFYRTPSTSTVSRVSESVDFFLERLQLSSEYLH